MMKSLTTFLLAAAIGVASALGTAWVQSSLTPRPGAFLVVDSQGRLILDPYRQPVQPWQPPPWWRPGMLGSQTGLAVPPGGLTLPGVIGDRPDAGK